MAYPITDYNYYRGNDDAPPTVDNMVFDGVVVSSSAYNPDTSTFTCPISGLYAFFLDAKVNSIQYCDYSPSRIDVLLYKNDDVIKNGMPMRSGFDATNFNNNVVFTLVQCNAGERVKAVLVNGSTNAICSIRLARTYGDGPVSTFGGYLVQAN